MNQCDEVESDFEEANPILDKADELYSRPCSKDISVKLAFDDPVFTALEERIRDKTNEIKQSRTAKLWLFFGEMVAILKRFLLAERTGDWQLDLSTLQEMLPYYAAAGHNLYAKSVYLYLSQMQDLDRVHQSSTGYLLQGKRFDYEDTAIQCGLGKGGGYLNITAEDGPYKISTSLSVMFVDVDDTPPVFVHSDCSSTCFACSVSAINANIQYADQGTVVTNPPRIKALDPDTDPTNILYSMEVYPEKYRDNIRFDNGIFVLLKSFGNFSGYAEKSDFTVTVTLQGPIPLDPPSIKALDPNTMPSSTITYTMEGSVIFVSNETKAIRKEWSLSSYDPRVALTFVKGTYQVVLLSAVDLDVANLGDICSPPEQFVQRITCYRNGQDPIIHWITFQVQPVNENPPEADTLPEIRISEKDVGEYFMINSSTGFLSQVKHFDYEDTEIQCNLGKGGGFVKIIAEDGLYKTSKSLSVTFINIDDAPPVFVNSDCSTVCYKCPILSLSAIVHFTYHGPILTNPPGIKAIDLDTEQSNIIDYNLDIYPTKYKDIIRFEDGRFVLLQSFANFSEYKKESDFTVIVTIQQEYITGTGHHLTALQNHPVLTLHSLTMFTLTKRLLLVDKDVTFHVRPVNEHPPTVGDLPGIQISEMQVAHDASYFFMINSTSGFLYQSKVFDNEDIYSFIHCDQWKEGGFLNITANDGIHKTSKSLRVTFVDIDDHPPVFVMSGCTTICYVCPRTYLEATVNYYGQDSINTYPPYITVLDPDTSTTNFTYDMEGSVIFVSSETKSQTKEWFLTSIEPRVALTCVKQTYQVVLLSEVDLDVPNPSDTCFPPQLQFMQRITCFRHFLDPGNVSVPLFLHRLFDYFKDRDCPKERLFLSISKYSSVEDGLYKTSKSLSVAFINIDDAPPVFVNSDCSNVCFKCPLSSLSAFVHITHQGLIPTNPPAIKAIYPGSNVVYDMDVYPTKYSDNIRFENGTFVLPQSFANFSGYAEESDFTVTVIMQATGSNGQTSDKFPFSIHLNTRPISSTSQQITDQTSSGPTKDKRVHVPVHVPARMNVN
uniref:Cadherin domain-containing protein n=1 Tax=Magallana gigas TaxID=29159 RepID=K1QT07_MAGGI